MNPIWLMLVALVAFLLIVRLKSRRKRQPRSPFYARRIDGFQVVATLGPEMPSGCLFDHGTQFGRGFRRKEGPSLPHGQGCRCTTVPFSFNSNEVFNGALRNFAEVRGEVKGLDQGAAGRLVETLKRIESGPLPPTREAYLALAELEEFSQAARPVVEEFLNRRYAFLSSGGARPSHLPQAASPRRIKGPGF